MEYRYWYHEPQLSAALNFVKQLQAEARRLATSYIHARDKYLHAIRICYQFGFEETAHELFCELSMMATRHGLFNDALQYARKCGPTYPKGYLAEAFACESLCRNHLGGSLYLDSCFISYARYVQVTKDHDAFIQAMKLATDFDVPLNKALMDSARDSVCKIVQKLIQKEWCTAKHLLALLSMDTNAATQASLTLSRVLHLKELNPNILRDLIKNGIKVVADDFEDAISVLSDDNVDLIKVLTSEVEGSPDYAGLWYQTIRDKPVLARHFFMCWAHPDTKNELGSMYGSIAEKCNPYERTSLFTKALEKGDGDFADQLLSGGSIIGSEINLCLLLSYLAQPVFKLSVASSILTHLQKQGVSFEGTSNSSLKPIECILMDEKSDTLKKASFLTVLLKNGYSIDALELKSIQSTAIHEITKICLETGDAYILAG